MAQDLLDRDLLVHLEVCLSLLRVHQLQGPNDLLRHQSGHVHILPLHLQDPSEGLPVRKGVRDQKAEQNQDGPQQGVHLPLAHLHALVPLRSLQVLLRGDQGDRLLILVRPGGGSFILYASSTMILVGPHDGPQPPLGPSPRHSPTNTPPPLSLSLSLAQIPLFPLSAPAKEFQDDHLGDHNGVLLHKTKLCAARMTMFLFYFITLLNRTILWFSGFEALICWMRRADMA